MVCVCARARRPASVWVGACAPEHATEGALRQDGARGPCNGACAAVQASMHVC
jgi:hypothetical protein